MILKVFSNLNDSMIEELTTVGYGQSVVYEAPVNCSQNKIKQGFLNGVYQCIW